MLDDVLVQIIYTSSPSMTYCQDYILVLRYPSGIEGKKKDHNIITPLKLIEKVYITDKLLQGQSVQLH